MKKILVIEDEHELRKDVMEMLRYEGFDVMGAENGTNGLQMAKNYLPDLILCDIMMPGGVNGFDVLKGLSTERSTSLIPFIFVTARTELHDIQEGMGLGADDYLTKPFKVDDLLRAINTRLKKRADMEADSRTKIETLTKNIMTSLPHELRTPLNLIIGFSDLMMTDADQITPDLIREWSQEIHNGGMRLLRLFENYLEFARIETLTRDDSQLEPLRSARTTTPGSHIEYQAQVKAQNLKRQADMKITVDETRSIIMSEDDLKKIIEELLDNAFKFSTPESEVCIEAKPENDHYVISITDHGRGMTPEQIRDIGAYMQFERWFYEHQGIGLGLTIARRLAELYGGSLTIESEPKVKTVVSIKLLLDKAEEKAGA